LSSIRKYQSIEEDYTFHSLEYYQILLLASLHSVKGQTSDGLWHLSSSSVTLHGGAYAM